VKNCVQCSAPFIGKRSHAIYCSRECASRAFHERRQARGHDRKIHQLICTGCGKEFNGRRRSKYCSQRCSTTTSQALATVAASQANRKPRELVLYEGPPLIRQPESTWVKTKNRLTSGQCKVCSTWFVSFHTDVTCSAECRAMHNRLVIQVCRDRRRARKRDAFVEVVYRKKVFERDGYRCHLCGKRTNPNRPVPHPKAPTIDHIIPLAAGGTHEPLNCRTACFLCNSRKGNRGGGEQLMLIA
jgi:hypothetical protein